MTIRPPGPGEVGPDLQLAAWSRVADVGGRVVGTIGLLERDGGCWAYGWKCEPDAPIAAAAALYKAALSEGRRRGHTALQIAVDAGDARLNEFYLGRGWRPVATLYTLDLKGGS